MDALEANGVELPFAELGSGGLLKMLPDGLHEGDAISIPWPLPACDTISAPLYPLRAADTRRTTLVMTPVTRAELFNPPIDGIVAELC
jgi:hypothetical protein